MFTGLVETVGSVTAVDSGGIDCRLEIASGLVADGAKDGDSVAINGCCLTVVECLGETLAFEAGSETLSRTNLGQLVSGSSVNLERAMKASDRLGGHFVTGHVDALGKITHRSDDGRWAEFRFSVPPELTRQMASKGSVAVDGISLTLVDVLEAEFSVALIPHTLEVTTLGDKQPGDTVNIETDLLAKYVQRQLAGGE